eukprot:COSAG02_NODE_8908_length_2403_cov_4.127170_3_plen_149_part_01
MHDRIFDADIDDMRPADRLVCETHLIDTMQIFDFDHEERDEQSGGLGEDGKALALDAAVHCCLQAGTDPTHLTAVVARHMQLLEFLGARDRANTPRILGAVTEFWACSNQQLIVSVLRLLSMRIVPSPAALISFVLDDSNRDHLESSHW